MQFLRSHPARCVLAVLSGAVCALAYPPLDCSWLVVPGMLGLLIALQGQTGTRARTLGFIHGLAAYGVGLFWLFQVFGNMTVMLWCVLAAFTALFAEFQSRAATRGLTGWRMAGFTTLNWCGWEFIRAELFPLKFPWMTTGLAVGPNALLPWIGVYGVSLLVFFGITLAFMRKWKPALGVGVPLVLSAALFPRVAQPIAGDPGTVKVGGLQMENVSLDRFLKGTAELPADVRFAVWPEYAVPFDLRKNERDWKLVRDLCRERDLTLTLGTQNRYENQAWRNIALTLDANGTLGEHNKVHTVHFFDDGIPGNSAMPVQTRHGKVGTPVCFDCDYEGIVRRMSAAGAEMFVIPIMDAAPWTAAQHDQHAELFRIRACENGRWIFVCATSGVSQVIDPHGGIHGRLAALTEGSLTGVLRRETGLTCYTRVGWLVPWIALAAAIFCWIALVLPRRKSRAISAS